MKVAAAIKAMSQMYLVRNAFKIEDFDTKSTLSGLFKCSEKKERFCSRMARNGKRVELLKFLRVQGCLGIGLLVIKLPKMVTSSV